jgi:serine/threonine protein phosphatase PrpC
MLFLGGGVRLGRVRAFSSPPPPKTFTSSSKVLVATATAGASFAAYYCATALLFTSAITTSVNGETIPTTKYQVESKSDENYGIKYIGFDSYAGIHTDRRTGVASREETATSTAVVAKALEAAGLDKSGIVKGITADNETGMTLHPNHVHRIGVGTTCPVYSCPFLPLDVHHDANVKSQLQQLRKSSSSAVEPIGKDSILISAGSDKAATLTLIGYKGGKVEHQINQDRALALAPYLYHNINKSDDVVHQQQQRPAAKLIGVFDGHALHGEKVSEYVVKTLPALLGSKLANYDPTISTDDDNISRILHQTFRELDATSPARPSGGCTATVLLQLGTKIYIANSGDSRSFVAVHITHPSNGSTTTQIIFGTREDKPHLSTERKRVEHMGGKVYIPPGFIETGQGATRVLYKDPTTGSTSGLAMSRSIGDWDAGEVGVIPDPMIDILDMKEIKKKVLENLNDTSCKDTATNEVEINPINGEPSPVVDNTCVTYTEKDVKIFAISATDGLLDYLPEQDIVQHVGKGLYETKDAVGTRHPLLSCEDLIYAAAQGWEKDKGGRYRDDIAMAVADLEDGL